MKKIISLLLIFAMVSTFIIGASAYDSVSDLDEIEEEIQTILDDKMECVYHQLEAQGSLGYMEYFRELLYYQIMCDVYLEHGIQYPYDSPYGYDDEVPIPPDCVLEYGGVVHYYTNSKTLETTVTLLDWQRTLDYILAQKSFSLGTIVKSLIGFIPVYGGIYSTIISIQDQQTYSSIYDADCYTEIFTVGPPKNDKEATTIVLGWDNHPAFSIPKNATNWSVYYAPRYTES